MRRIQNSPLLLTCLALCAVISVAYAATPELGTKSNSYYLYTQALNTTALTAQMDLATAEKLQRELADIIAKKRENADYQYRPQLYDSSLIPTGEIKGVDSNGELIIQLKHGNAK